jgi:diphthamide biosynthesis protein 2
MPVLYNEIQTSSTPVGTAGSSTAHAQLGGSTNIDIPLEHTTIFYIGEESLGLTNLLMTNAFCDVGSPDFHISHTS